MTDKLNLVWKDSRALSINMLDNPVATAYWNLTKHLQHVDLTFNVRKNPLHPDHKNVSVLLRQLSNLLSELGIIIDSTKTSNQEYLNQLHEIYFSHAKQTTYDERWLIIHDLIHSLETAQGLNTHDTDIWIDYEKKAGLLIKPFDRSWLQYKTAKITAGTCYIMAHELGKTPYIYYQDNEPADIDIMTQLMKPWVDFKPVLSIATKDRDLSTKPLAIKEQFTQWFAPFKDAWTKHWNIDDWTYDEIYAAIPVGHIDNIEQLIECFKNEDYPIRITR